MQSYDPTCKGVRGQSSSFFIKGTTLLRLVGRVKSTFGPEEMCVAEVSAGQVGGVTTMSTGPILGGEMHLSDDDGDDGGGDEGDDDGQVAGIGAISTGRFVGIKIKFIWSKNAVPLH